MATFTNDSKFTPHLLPSKSHFACLDVGLGQQHLKLSI